MPHNTRINEKNLTLGDNYGYFPNLFEDEVKREKIGN